MGSFKFVPDIEKVTYMLADENSQGHLDRWEDLVALELFLDEVSKSLKPLEYLILTQKFGIHDSRIDYSKLCVNMDHPFFKMEKMPN